MWTYGLLQVTPPVDAVIMKLYEDLVGPYWPPERYLVEAGYRTIPFPFEEIHPRLSPSNYWPLHLRLGRVVS